MITVIGGGSLSNTPEDLSGRCQRRIKDAKQVVLQSERQALRQAFPGALTLDRFFAESTDFDRLYAACADELSRLKDVTFIAIGDGVYNGIARALLARRLGEIHILPYGLPALLAGAMERNLLPGDRHLMMSGYEALTADLDNNLPTILTGIDTKELLSDVKLRLMEYYPDDWPVLLGDGMKELWQVDGSLPLEIYLPPLPFLDKRSYSYRDLERIVARLRQDCPWDRVQTHASIRKHLIEEAFELLEAIDRKDTDMMVEEMGDVLLQVALHNQIALDKKDVYRDDVTTAICQKMIRRHPHVYGGQEAGKDGGRGGWEASKAEEYGFTTKTDALRHVSDYLPSLMRAQKLVRKAERAGYSIKPDEHFLSEVLRRETMTEEEAGRLLLLLVERMERAGICPFTALNDACRRLIADFERWESEDTPDC